MMTKPRTFRCENCSEMINDSMAQCRYCSVPIDPGVASMLAERQEKANQAYSDASYLRTAAVAMYVFLAIGLRLALAYFGFVATFAVVTVLLLRWQMSFNDLLTNDPDFKRARRSKNISLLLLVGAVPLGLIFNPFWGLIFSELGIE